MSLSNIGYREFCNYHNYKFIVTVKKRNPIQWIIAAFLYLTHINKRYMKDFYTTILNFLSVPTVQDKQEIVRSTNLPVRRLQLVAHEGCHVVQRRRDGFLKHTLRYLFSGHWRTVYESEAYKISMLVHLLYGERQEAYWYVDNTAKILHNDYGVNSKHLVAVRLDMQRSYDRFKAELYDTDLEKETALFIMTHK